jgi:uncharacterized protein YkwD
VPGRNARPALTLTALSALVAVTYAGGYGYRPPSPSGELLVRRPEIVWHVWGTGGSSVTSVSMTVGGSKVGASYSEQRKAVVYRPAAPLRDGKHDVVCEVTLDGRFRAKQAWSVTVRAEAVEALPGPSDAAVEAKRAVESLRALHGLGPLQTCPELTASAALQLRIVGRTGRLEHEQGSGPEGDPQGRARLHGYSGAVSELLAYTSGNPAQSVRALFDAPYHRVPLLAPGNPDFGAAVSGPYTAMVVGEGAQGFSVSPGEGQAGVPCSWDGVETPSPARGSGLSAPFGYPVVAAWFGTPSSASLLSAKLFREGGGEVACIVRHPGNDAFAQSAVILVPHNPLSSGARYTAEVGILLGGKVERRRWSFTTAAR